MILATLLTAQSISNTANQVAGGLMAQFGTGGFDGIAEFLRGKILLVIAPIGIFFVVRSGMRLINSQEEDKLTKAKNTISATCVGIMFAFISDRLVMSFYTPGGTWDRTAATTGANILTLEILGILNWLTVFIASLSVLMIIVSGIRAVSSFSSEDIAVVKRSVMGVIAGIVLITSAGALKLALGLAPGVIATLPTGANPSSLINRGIGITLTLLSFTAVIALAVIVYAGLMMVFNLGNDEQYTKAKSLIFRSVIGLLVMLLSGAAIVFIAELVI